MKFAAITAVAAAFLIATPAMAEDLHFEVHNNSNQTITEIYLSPVGQNTWGSNILDGDVAQGGDVAVTVGDGETVCHYDVKVVFENAQKVYPGQNLCELDGGAYNVL